MMSIIGRKNAGKTTLLVALAAELVRRKFRVMTIKHGTHPADTDQRGKDSWRHWHEGRAERVLMEGPGQRVLWERTEQESLPGALHEDPLDRKSTRLNSSHRCSSYAVFCLKKKKQRGVCACGRPLRT